MSRALLALCAALLALAAPAQIEAPDEPTVFADFGFGNVMPAGCWAPITVAVQAIDEPLSGYVELSYAAGGEQISHIAPFAVAAQSNALIPMTVHLPWWTDTVSVAAYDERQGRVAQLDYSELPGPTDARLPALLRPESFILSATTRLPAAVAIDAIRSPEETEGGTAPAGRGGTLRAINITPDRLPPNRLAYDSIELLIIEPANLRGVDPRAIEAILRWTASGGKLLLLVDRPGAEHARWLAATPATAAINIGAITTPDTASRRAVRPLSLSPVARSAGWSVIGEPGTRPAAATAAAGPFALGWLGVVTADPLASGADTRALRDLLAPFADDVDEPPDDLVGALTGDRASWYEPFPGRSSDELLYRHIDAIASTQPPGAGGFILIAAVPLTLALLLGPFDFVLLGLLRRRPLAWLSALVWIAAIGTIAFTVPRLFQTGDADVGNAAATDLILPNLAIPLNGPENAAAQIPRHLAGWSAEATLLFHASQAPFTLESSSRSAWRPFETGRADGVAFSGMTFRQTPTGPGANAHAGIEPLRIPSRIWSLVTLHAEGPAPPTFAVALRQEAGADSFIAEITNLPETARIAAARIIYEGQTHGLTEMSGTTLNFAPTLPGSNGWETPNDGRPTLATLAVLAGEPARRDASIAALQRAGWARLDLLIENPPATATFITDDDTTRTRFTHYRILTPMPESPQ